MPDEIDCDWVVVGSGFGGAVAALRLAQKGYSVTVVEAGRRWRADEFPRSTWDARRYLWMPRLGLRGILGVDVLRHLVAVRGVGVGGGSLVYGNTLFRPLPSFFASPGGRALGGAESLRPYYELGERMLGVVPNPRLGEVDRAVRETAEEYGRGDTFTPSPVAIYFGEPGVLAPDPYFDGDGEPRTGCTSCGGCFVGCRFGAKNTLDRNYLLFAERLGARVVPETRVVALRPLSDDGAAGWEVETRRSTHLFGRPRGRLRARGVVLAAGVIGTVDLLLASRAALPRLSARVGRDVRTNSEAILAVTVRDRAADLSRGVAASSSVFPDEHTQIQADRYPDGSDTLALASTVLVDGGGALPRWLRALAAILRRPLEWLSSLSPRGFARRSVVLVVMQDHDSGLRLERRRRWLWPLSRGLASRDGDGPRAPTYIPMGNDFARRLALRIGGVPRGSVTESFFDVPVTAHILGGAIVGKSPAEGVVDDRHAVFGYRNLLVCDGSVIPANLGVNPALSIVALAERAMAGVPLRDAVGAPTLFGFERRWGVDGLLSGGPSTPSPGVDSA